MNRLPIDDPSDCHCDPCGSARKVVATTLRQSSLGLLRARECESGASQIVREQRSVLHRLGDAIERDAVAAVASARRRLA